MRKQTALFPILLLIASAAFAQHPAPGASPQSMGSMDCQAMMQEMKGSSKEMDDRVKVLVDDMNKAKGSARVDRMAAVITELVTQRRQMREHMMTMMPKMMGHMTQHMQSGMMSGMSGSMAGCPMMHKSADTPGTEKKH